MPHDNAIERIESLEILAAEQQKVIDDLSDIIAKQWDAHEVLKRQLAQMTDQLRDLEDNQPAPSAQKAPHY